MANQAEVNRLRAALKAIRYEVQQATEGDRNPNRGDLYRLDRIAADALEGES